MPSLADKVRFAELHVRTPDGEPFSLEGRGWVVEQVWRPLDGWKLWPVDPDRLCGGCSSKANTVVDDYHSSDKTRTKAHAGKQQCAGLTSEPILISAVELKRQSGKTFNTAALVLSRTFLDSRESIALLAGSEDQVARLYNKNYVRAVGQDEELADSCVMRGTSIVCEDTGSDLEILPTALSSVGDTRTMVVIDECRVVPPDVAVAMVPTLFARGGWQCPDYHIKTHGGVEDPKAPKRCSVCKKRLEPWYGKALLLSSAGELKDTEADWFFEFVDHYKDNPHPNVHVFASKAKLNPKVSQKVVDVTTDVFGALESTRQFAGIEGAGERLRKGEDVVTPSDVARVCDKSLRNEEGCGAPAVAFIDTSTADEKTSIVILADDTELSTYPWEYVYLSHLRFWWPRKMTKRVINPAEVEQYITSIMPLYPSLEWIDLDVLGGTTRARKASEDASLVQWPTKMLHRFRKSRAGWVKKLHAWRGTSAENDAGWSIMVDRIIDQTVLFQDVREIKDEFRGVKRDAQMRVKDRNRATIHMDITQAIACACYRIATLQHRSNGLSLSRVVRVQRGGIGLRGTPVTRGLRPGKF